MRICRLSGPHIPALCSAILASCCAIAVAQASDTSKNRPGDSSVVDSAPNSFQYPKGDEIPVRNSAAVLYNSCKGGHVDIEALNQLGSDSAFPAFADSITEADNPLRRS